jgi:ParB family chromosome partitioning protein
MAKRRRLTPAQPGYLSAVPAPSGPPALRAGIGAPPPIAQVAGEASALAALREVSGALDAARAEGRLLLRLPLEAVEADYLVRDRLVADEEDLGHLMASIAEHGQRSPIEVAELGSGRYGLISGWRRLTALTRLAGDDSARFGTVLAQVRRPETAASAYVAMVEENEVRSGLSYYERARVTAKAVEAGVFQTEKAALQQLFSAASRARRSKIGSFLTIHRYLDGALRFPAALPERLGLALAHFLEADPAAGRLLHSGLSARPAATAAEEQSRLTRVVATASANAAVEGDSGSSDTVPAPEAVRAQPPAPLSLDTRELRPGLFLRTKGDLANPTLELTGPALDPTLRDRLEAWLTAQP